MKTILALVARISLIPLIKKAREINPRACFATANQRAISTLKALSAFDHAG
jgi:hypothetical protein